MEIFANTTSNSNSKSACNGITEATFAGNEKENEFSKRDLFYHTFHPNLPVVNNKTEKGENGASSSRPENSNNVQSNKISINGIELEKFKNENISLTKNLKGKEAPPTSKKTLPTRHQDPPTEKQINVTTTNASISSPIDWSIDISDNISGIDSMETPSSLNISTPQRIKDIDTIQQKLNALNINNKK